MTSAALRFPRRLARIASFMVHYGWRRGHQVEIEGVTTRFKTSDRYSKRWFFPRYVGGRMHEESITRQLVDLCRDRKCFLDVGANLGWFTCVVADHMEHGEVHSFEIDDLNYSLLTANVALNGLSNVTPNLLAVGDREGVVEYFRPRHRASPMSGLFMNDDDHRERVARKMIRLDDYVDDLRHPPDVIKIDVEGAEMLVLKGAAETLSRFKPALLIEVHPDNMRRSGQSAASLIAALENLGYSVRRVLDPRGRDSRFVTEPIDQTLSANWTVYAR